MGRSQRPRPVRLAAKLLQIRSCLGLTQRQMIELLNYHQSPLYVGYLSEFEQDKREPPLLLLLQYARITGMCLDVLVDDDLDLPEILGLALPKALDVMC